MAQTHSQKFAPPISHDNVFFYYGGHPNFSFYVKVENRGVFHQHPRAEPSYLHSLLTHQAVAGPGAAHHNVPSFKDETEHFYCAQLLHYGLKPLKTKAPAKKALLTAFGNGNTLLVPNHILELERRLRQEYELANAQLGYAERKTERKTQGHRGNEKLGQVFAQGTLASTKPPIQEVRRQAPVKAAPQPMARTKQTAVKSNGKKPTVGGSKKPTHADTTGSFDVHAPSLSSEWPDMCPEGFTLEMAPSKKTGRHFWASFDFGIITGVMRCSRPPTAVGGTCTFTWRGEESSEGQILFGDSQKGTITFLGGGRFKGVMEGAFFGKAQFEGRRNEDAATNHACGVYVKDWKSQYRSINGSAYAVAGTSRWGGWVEDTSRPDRPADSDSSAGGAFDSEYSGDETPEDRRTAGYPAGRASGSKLGSTSQPTTLGRRTKQTARKSAYNPHTRRSYDNEFGHALSDSVGSDWDDEPAAKKSKTKQPEAARQTSTSRLDMEPPTYRRRTKQTARKSGYRVPARWRDEEFGEGYGSESDDRGSEGYIDDELRTIEGVPKLRLEDTAPVEAPPAVRPRRTKLTARKSAYRVPESQEVKLKPRDTTGSFEVQAPELSNGRSYQTVDAPPKLWLKLLPSRSKRRLWASFDFGIASGIMRGWAETPVVVGNACSFKWRGKKGGADDEGELIFGQDNFGAVTFFGDGKIRVIIEGSFFARMTFTGTQTGERTTSKVWKNHLREWKVRYRSINYTAHAIAHRARWGGSNQQQTHTEGPAASDTSDDEMDVDPDYGGGNYDSPYVL